MGKFHHDQAAGLVSPKASYQLVEPSMSLLVDKRNKRKHYECLCVFFVFTSIYIYMYRYHTSSTAQGGGGSFKNRRRIGEIDCCE